MSADSVSDFFRAKTIISKANGDTQYNLLMDIRSDNSQIYAGGYTPTGSDIHSLNANFSIIWYHLLWTDNGVEHKYMLMGRRYVQRKVPQE